VSEAAHWAYVAAAYAAGLIIVGALVIHTVLDARAQRRTLARLEPTAPSAPGAGGTKARP
jgi:heme exporter protein CcmD